MTPDERQKLEEVYEFIQMMKSANSIPLPVDQALSGRGFVKGALSSKVIVSSGSTGTATTQNITVSTTPQTITVPAQPSGTISITIGNTTYKLLYQ